MMRQRLLTYATVSFAVAAIVLGLWGMLDPSIRLVHHVVLVPGCLMLLTGGLNRLLDRRKDGFISIAAGLLVVTLLVIRSKW